MATCHFANDNLDQCLAKLDEIEQRHSSSEIYDRSLNYVVMFFRHKQNGQLLEKLTLKESLAEQAGHYQVAAEALSQLVPVAIAQEKYKGLLNTMMISLKAIQVTLDKSCNGSYGSNS